MSRKGEMGIGTLIIFIALLLVAAIAAGVLIQTSGSLQEKALTTGDQAKGQIATNVRVIEVSATDGGSGTLRHYTQIMKLAPGSEPIKLDQTLFTMNTFDRTATLQYNDDGTSYNNDITGYYTLSTETATGAGNLTQDYDDDGTADELSGGATNSTLYLNLSGGDSVDLGNCDGATYNDSMASNNYISSISGATCNAGGDVTSITLTPVNLGQGEFAVEYLQVGANWVEGNLQRGDVIKLYYEAPKDIGEDEKVRLNFIPKIGTPTLTEFITPEVISEERVYLYP